MTKIEAAAMEYAKTHLQAVRICWIDRPSEICSAEEAVILCSDYGVSGYIVGVVAQDKRLEDMLHRIIDRE